MEFASMMDTSSLTSEEVLAWARQLEAHRIQTAMLYSLKEAKAFDAGRVENMGPKQSRNTRKTKVEFST